MIVERHQFTEIQRQAPGFQVSIVGWSMKWFGQQGFMGSRKSVVTEYLSIDFGREEWAKKARNLCAWTFREVRSGKTVCTVLHERGKPSGTKRYGYHQALPAINHSGWSCSQRRRRKKCAEWGTRVAAWTWNDI